MVGNSALQMDKAILRGLFHAVRLSPGVVTEWTFFVQDGALGYNERQKSDPPPEGGGHVRS